jgi:hypothetical protein
VKKMMNMPMGPTEEAAYALDFGVNRSDLSPAAQEQYDQMVADQQAYRAPAERPLTKEERKQARQARREDSARKRQEWGELATATTWLPSLGVAIRDGNVYQHGVDQNGMHSDFRAMTERAGRTEMKLLGPLAGARAEIAGGEAGRRRSGGKIATDTAFNTLMLGPVGLLSALSRKGFEIFAVVSFTNGTVVDKRFDKKSTDASLLRTAQGEAAQFNGLAASSQLAGGVAPSPPEGSAEGGTGVATELERLVVLYSSGMLDDEEFRAAKARIIGG